MEVWTCGASRNAKGGDSGEEGEGQGGLFGVWRGGPSLASLASNIETCFLVGFVDEIAIAERTRSCKFVAGI